MPKKPGPPNPDKDRRAFLRSVLLDGSSTQKEREAALEELEQLLHAVPEADLRPEPMEPSVRKQPPIPPLPLEAFLPKDGPPARPDPGQPQVLPADTENDFEEVIVQAAKPARYGPATASQDSFRRALRSALVFKVVYGIMQHFFAYHSSTVDAEARGHLQDLLNQARNTHPDWETLDHEIVGWKMELESNPLVWAQAVHDIAGNYQEFRQDVLQREVQERLQRPGLGERVREVLEDALNRSNAYQPTDKMAKYYRLESRGALVLDIPGPLLQEAVPEVRKRRPRQPDPPPVDITKPYFDRILQQVPTVPSAGPPPPVQKSDTIPGPSREDQLARINRMSPKDLADYVYNNPHQLLELTAAPSQASSGPPALYEVKDGTKTICVLDRSDYRLLLATVQQAVQDIAACKHHSKDRCDCWRFYRDQLGYYRDTRGADHPIAIALTYYWDLVEATATDRPKKDPTMDALQQLTTKIEAIAEQQSSIMDTQGAAWVGRKKGSKILGGKQDSHISN